MKVLTVSSDENNKGCLQLKRSLKRFGWQLDHIHASFEFGGQMKHVYEWCKKNWGFFLYTDAWDTFALSDEAEVIEKLPPCKVFISAEKNCYPIWETRERYPKCRTEYQYVNGGGFIADCEYFAKMYEETHKHDDNDQQWLAERYIERYASGDVVLDTTCQIFQTIAFENTWDFRRVVVETEEYTNGWKDRLRLLNNNTKSRPVFIHGNAHTPMEKIYKLL